MAGWSGAWVSRGAALCPVVQTGAGCQSPPRTPPSGHDTLTEGETSLVGETLGLYALHLGSPEGISPYPLPGPDSGGRADRPQWTPFQGPRCPHGPAPLPGEDGQRWLAFDSLNRKRRVVPRRGSAVSLVLLMALWGQSRSGRGGWGLTRDISRVWSRPLLLVPRIQ